MTDAATMKLIAEHLGVAVGIHHNGCCRLREVGAEHGSELHAVAHLLVEVVRIDDLEFVSCQRQFFVLPTSGSKAGSMSITSAAYVLKMSRR